MRLGYHVLCLSSARSSKPDFQKIKDTSINSWITEDNAIWRAFQGFGDKSVQIAEKKDVHWFSDEQISHDRHPEPTIPVQSVILPDKSYDSRSFISIADDSDQICYFSMERI